MQERIYPHRMVLVPFRFPICQSAFHLKIWFFEGISAQCTQVYHGNEIFNTFCTHNSKIIEYETIICKPGAFISAEGTGFHMNETRNNILFIANKRSSKNLEFCVTRSEDLWKMDFNEKNHIFLQAQ